MKTLKIFFVPLLLVSYLFNWLLRKFADQTVSWDGSIDRNQFRFPAVFTWTVPLNEKEESETVDLKVFLVSDRQTEFSDNSASGKKVAACSPLINCSLFLLNDQTPCLRERGRGHSSVDV
jgi:hypothetical protein